MGAFVDGRSSIEITESCSSLRAVLAEVGLRSPGVLDRVMDENGETRVHVNLFVNSENSRFLQGLDTPVPDGSTVLILAAISGG